MIRDLRWTIRATEEFENLMNYLLSEWGDHIAARVRLEIQLKIVRIHRSPENFPVFRKGKKIHKCVASPQTSIYFKVHPDFIEILSIFDNRQNPKKRKL